jgi:flagellar basal body rod protein FlgG
MEFRKKEFKKNEFNFALLGSGQFLVMCPNSGFQLTRRGHFTQHGGLLRDDQGCFLWHNGDELNPQGGPITIEASDDKLDEQGCFVNSKQCIAQIDLQDQIIKNVNFKDAKNLQIDFEGDLKKTTRSAILSNTLEQLDTKLRGPTGIPSWDYVDNLEFPIDCGK